MVLCKSRLFYFSKEEKTLIVSEIGSTLCVIFIYTHITAFCALLMFCSQSCSSLTCVCNIDQKIYLCDMITKSYIALAITMFPLDIYIYIFHSSMMYWLGHNCFVNKYKKYMCVCVI